MGFNEVSRIYSISVLLFFVATQVQLSFSENDRPIVGILAQQLSHRMIREHYDREYESYIAASYVKFIESAGARVVPIMIGRPESYYRDILSKINGVVFAGGNTRFDNNPLGNPAAAKIIYRLAKEMYDRGDYFPIWGACLGFELLTYLEADGEDHRIGCSSTKQMLPLIFKKNFKKSRMFGNASDSILNILRHENVTANFHIHCVTEEELVKRNLMSKFQILSENRDKNGLRFISSLEHAHYPFYGVQFHPEKNNYEWIARLGIPHSRNASLVGQYFADFFNNEVRKNCHRFPTPEEENRLLIYNFNPEYTGSQNGSSFEQCYFFKKNWQGVDQVC